MGAISHGDGLWQRGAEEAGGRPGAGGRQAGHLHHRAGRRLRRHRHDHARRQDAATRYVINGRKHWITGGGVSRLHLIFATRLRREGQRARHRRLPRHARRDARACKITQARADHGPARHAGGGDRRSRTWTCRPRWLVLPPSRACSRGFADLMNAYNSQRVGAGTVALGIAAGRLSSTRSTGRRSAEQFGRPIDEFQGLQWMLADMSIKLTAARRWSTTARARAGRTAAASPTRCWRRRPRSSPPRARSRSSTTRCSSSAPRGYSRELPLERMARDVRMFTIGGGTAQVLRTLVASQDAGLEAAADARRLRPNPSLRDAAE